MRPKWLKTGLTLLYRVPCGFLILGVLTLGVTHVFDIPITINPIRIVQLFAIAGGLFSITGTGLAWIVGTVRNAADRRWRPAASAFFGPLLAGALIVGLASVGLDADRMHFLLVKHTHEKELHRSTIGENARHRWNWGGSRTTIGVGFRLYAGVRSGRR